MGAVYSFLSKKQRALNTFDDVADDLMQHWHFYKNQNRLNEFIRTKFPEYLQPHPEVNLLEDLNAISQIEQRLNIENQITVASTVGDDGVSTRWTAAFKQDEIIYPTGNLESEAIARIVNVLNYLCYNYKRSTTS